MALLDIFGSTPSYYGGLLGEDELNRVRQQAQQQALQNTALALLQAGAPSRTPGNEALAIAQGLAGGQQAYRQTMQEGLKDKLQEMQIMDYQRKQKEAENEKARMRLAQGMLPYAMQEQVVNQGTYGRGLPVGDAVAEQLAQENAMFGPAGMRSLEESANYPVQDTRMAQAAMPAETAFVPNQAILGRLQQILPFKDFENVMQGIERRQKLTQPDYLTSGQTILQKTATGLKPVFKSQDFKIVDNAIYAVDENAPNGLRLAVDRSGKFTGDFGNLSKLMYGTDSPQNLTPEQSSKLLAEAKGYKKSGAGGDIINFPPGAVPVGKEGQNKLDALALTTGDRLAQLNRIEESFNPAYLETRFKGTQALRALGEKSGLSKLTPAQQQELTAFTQFQQDSVRSLNAYINEVTGAAIGQGEEADRIKAGMPNPGSGLFDGDSPTQFNAKLKNTLRDLRTVEARVQYIKANGLKLVDVPLNKMPDIMRKRETELIKSLALDVSKPEDKAILRNRLASEFGLMR
jgi:hypothetical protein